MTVLLHICPEDDWRTAQVHGRYEADSLSTEGFVHCSTPGQIEGVARRFFRGRRGLVLLVLDPGRLGVEVRLENLEGGEEPFPHVYGPIELDAVIAVHRLVTDPDGPLVIPAAVRG